MELNSVKRSKPLKFDQLGNLKEKSNHKGKILKTQWSDLKEIEFRQNEEHELKVMLGIPLPRYNGRQAGIGGGGNTMLRKEMSLNRLEGNLV